MIGARTMTTKKDNNLTKETLLAEIERLIKDSESERLNEMIKTRL